MSRTLRSFVAAILLGLVLTAAACAGSDREAAMTGAAVEAEQGRVEEPQMARAPAGLRAGDGQAFDQGAVVDSQISAERGSGPATRLPSVGPAVIKTADLGISIGKADLDDAIQDAIGIATRHGGFVLATSLDNKGDRNARIALRIPSRRFEMAVADLRQLGDVTGADIRGEDVGQEFVDLEARLRNWRTQEAVLLRLMDRATTVEETIRVQSELSSVQLEIERIRGQLRYLQDQTSLGTITAKFTTGAVAPNAPSTIHRAWNRALAGALDVLAALIVGAGFVVPLAALLLIAWVLVRQLRVRLQS